MAIASTPSSSSSSGTYGCGSQFFFTLNSDIAYLDGKHAPFGTVVEGMEVLDKLNEIFLDGEGRPMRDVRIRHVEVLGGWRSTNMSTA